ncbi:MAG: pyrimidine 5'-nucleotidase [Pseudomonadota bacterium]|uniref:pyrimidine 5'-nucleotidase n=1 Tax=Gallaecimonas pentaromativorans TaxID=584787 RepID=UPI00067F31E4|nr:pyrimidine 5'-nucleotidase [Gallaecimonas pentaromativorans]MED5525356.1 pyrimidine 5'-nucleotidase [Pseudomonadota bacterium]
MQYQWVLFDADETLFYFDSKGGLKSLLARYGHDMTEQCFSDFQAINLKLWDQYHLGQIDMLALQHGRFAHFGRQFGVEPTTLNSQFQDAMVDNCPPMVGAHELLHSLKGRAKLGIISNGFKAMQPGRLAKAGWHEIFDLVVTSEEAGIAKPDPAIFHYSFEKMGGQPQKALMVGDNPHADVAGGAGVGLDTCWFNRHGKARPDGITPTFEVSALSDLQALLA